MDLHVTPQESDIKASDEVCALKYFKSLQPPLGILICSQDGGTTGLDGLQGLPNTREICALSDKGDLV